MMMLMKHSRSIKEKVLYTVSLYSISFLIFRFGQSGVTLGNSMKVMLPSVAGSQSCLHAVLERDPFNTIALHLLPDVLVINRSPVTLQLLTSVTENTDSLDDLTNEGGEGVKEIVSTLDPNNVSLLPQNKVCSYNVYFLSVLKLFVSPVSFAY